MNAILLLGFAIAAFVATVFLVAPLCATVSDALGRRWPQSSSFRGALALLPIAVGVGVVLSILSPQALFGRCHCVAHPHHLHLCFQHAVFSWPLVACAVIGFACLVPIANEAWKLVADCRATSRWVSSLSTRRAEFAGGADVEIDDALGPQAITVGLFRARVIVGARLWSTLAPEDRAAIAAHERAHASRRDPLTLLCLRIAVCVMPTRSGARLVDGWKRSAELSCDRLAACWIGDASSVAAALIACGRLQLATSTRVCAGSLAATTGDDLELRVKSLLASASDRASRISARGDLFELAAAAAAVAIAVTAVGGHSAHHAMETLLGWIS
ncbi:MAG: hypothetical protein HOW73_16800 [Polyangiaceae bacterium]|nr:hypothetical protein [Polyangiaceae bacterium]